MKFSNRLFRIMSALAITGIVAAQIPTRSSISLAADGYPDSGLTTTDALNGLLILGIGGYAVQAIGGGWKVNLVGGSLPNIKDLKSDSKEYAAISKALNILKIANIELGDNFGGNTLSPSAVADLGLSGVAIKPVGTTEASTSTAQGKGVTLFLPTNESLEKTLGAEQVALLQKPGQQARAKAFILANAISGGYKVNDLNGIAKLSKSLESLSGETISLKLDGSKILANTAEILGNEIPVQGGIIVTTNGVINTEF